VSEHLILYVAGGILATITAIRFILQELTTVVLLYKKLKASIKAELPVESGSPSERPSSTRKLGV
jgi:hypothetical protein